MRTLATFFLVLLLSACGGEPDVHTLRTDIEARLAEALPDNVLEITLLERRGAQADTKAPAGETRRIVYFDTELRLTRDIDFGGWDERGVAGLVSALGVGPKGIIGITSGGNQAGDLIRAHGTALYKREGDAWVHALPAGYRPAVAPQLGAAARGPSAVLDAIRQIIESVPRDLSPAVDTAVTQELLLAQTNIRARLARASEGYAIAAGAEHGQYLRVARALFDDPSAHTVPLITRGGEENLALLRTGTVRLALAQADSAFDAYHGTGAFADTGPHLALRAIGSLYPEPIHVIVRASDGATTMSELRGKRIAIGEPGAASRTTVLRVLAAHGLQPADFQPYGLDLGMALVGLQQGQVDAVMQVIGMPSDSIRDAMTNVPLRLLPLDEQAIEALASAGTGYFAHTIAAGTYAGQTADVRTIATAALLLTDANLSETEINNFTQLVYAPSRRDLLSLGSTQGAQISAETAGLGLSIPQHLAAARFLDALRPPY